MKPIDLHIHSRYSPDGELSVAQILDQCKNSGMKTIAITDHNRVGGVSEALRYGAQLGLEVIPGIEIDCTFRGIDLHLLGYYIAPDRPEWHRLAAEMTEQEWEVLPRMLAELRQLGIEADLTVILDKASGNAPSPELIAEVALADPVNDDLALLQPYRNGGERSDMPYLNFYRDFFAPGKPAHVPLEYMGLQAAVDLIRKDNGIPVIAHPGDNLLHVPEMIDPILATGVRGIEVFSNYHLPSQTEFYYRKARASRALITGGSDFHGQNKPQIRIGGFNCPLNPMELVATLRQAHEAS